MQHRVPAISEFGGKVALSMALLWGSVFLAGCGGGASGAAEQRVAVSVASPVAATANARPELDQKQAVNNVKPVTGWYWNPTEAGRGFAIERQGDKLFVAAFLYETSGAPTWYVGTLAENASGQFVGEFSRYTGGQSLLGSFKEPVAAKVADVVLTFSSSTAGTLQATPVGGGATTINIQRYAISSPAFEPSSVPFANGWYWNDAAGGRGYFIEVQGTRAFIGSFMYDTSGQPIWYVSTASVDKLASVVGSLQQFSGGQSLTGVFKSPTENPVSPGRMSFDLASNGQGQMVLPNNTKVPMKPFAFNGGQATVPQASCSEGQARSNGACVTVSEPLIIVPQIKLLVGVVPQMGQTYQIAICYPGSGSCEGLHTAQYVSYEDLRDPDTPAILAYVDQVMVAFQRMIAQMAKAGTTPSAAQMKSAFGNAIDKAIKNQTQTAEADALAALNALGANLTAEGTPATAAEACAAAAPPGPVVMYTTAGGLPEKCYKNRLSTFGWTGTDDATVMDACMGAQDRGGNADHEFFNSQNVSACYCRANGKVNTVTQKFVCFVFFDAGR